MAAPELDQPGCLPPHGGYRELLSYQKAEVVYDITYRFCQRFLTKGDRTIDQMVQAARSGKQNIAEGSQASGGIRERMTRARLQHRNSASAPQQGRKQ
jgi:hypothetical protein